MKCDVFLSFCYNRSLGLAFFFFFYALSVYSWNYNHHNQAFKQTKTPYYTYYLIAWFLFSFKNNMDIFTTQDLFESLSHSEIFKRNLYFLLAQLVKNPSAMQETWIQSLGWEDPLEKRTATHSSILAWRSPWTIQFMGSPKSQT